MYLGNFPSQNSPTHFTDEPYPEGDSYVATFDYTIDEDITQYILAIEFDAAGDVINVSMDS